MAATAGSTERRDALVERLFTDAIGAFDLLSVYLGDVLGLYRVLTDKGPLTSTELAEPRASTSATRASGWSTRRRAACSSWSRTETPAATGSRRVTTRHCSTHRA
jgi:hypothetical protein